MTDTEEKKAYLRRYGYVREAIHNIELEIERIFTEITSITSKYSGMPKGAAEHDPMPDYIEKLQEMQKKLRKKQNELFDVKDEIENAIGQMDDNNDKLLLKYRYIDLRTWSEIAELMGYVKRHVTRLHGRALQNFKMS